MIGLVLALGITGVAAAWQARAILQREIAASYQRANSPDVVLWFDAVDPALLEKVRARAGVAAADMRRTALTRVATKSGAWFPMRVTMMADLPGQRVGALHRHDGDWPKAEGIFIEQSGLPLLQASPGESLRVRTPGGGIAEVSIAGTVHDTAVAPSLQDRVIYAYVTPATAASLGLGANFDQILVKMSEREDLSDAIQFAGTLREWLTKENQAPLRADALRNEHPHAMLMSTMLRVLGVLAAMAFVCSAALAAYVTSLWMARQVRQVGIMKTIGARSHQLAWQYLALVGPLVITAAAVALPLGTAAGRWLVRYYAVSLNIDVTDWSVPASLQLSELLLAIGIPLLALAVPIVRAARRSVRDAIQDPGITTPVPAGRFSRWLKVPGSLRWTFALRNTFRRPWRLALTLLALSAGGALFLTANHTYKSLMRVVDTALAQQGHDIEVQLQKSAPASQIEALVRELPDVEIAEAWRRTGVAAGSIGDDSAAADASRRFVLTGFPPETRLLKLPLQAGRWPLADETDAVVISRLVANAIPGLQVGGELTLRFRDRRAKVRVVGLVEEIGIPVIHAGFPTFEAITGLGDAANVLRVKARGDAQESVARAVDQALLDAHLTPSALQTRGEFRASLDEHFAVVTDVMKMIALAAALVGAISLAASISLNVLERTREVGIIRALGATPRSVMAIFLAEGGAVALVSMLLSIAASILLHAGAEFDGIARPAARGRAAATFLDGPRAVLRRRPGRDARRLAAAGANAAPVRARRPRLRMTRPAIRRLQTASEISHSSDGTPEDDRESRVARRRPAGLPPARPHRHHAAGRSRGRNLPGRPLPALQDEG